MADLEAESDEPVRSKRFKNLVVNRGQSTGSPGAKAIEDELSNYIDNDATSWDEEADPIDFWRDCTAYPKLADYAVDLLIVPSSSSASETLFSHAGFLSKGIRNRVSSVNLENQVLIKANKDILS